MITTNFNYWELQDFNNLKITKHMNGFNRNVAGLSLGLGYSPGGPRFEFGKFWERGGCIIILGKIKTFGGFLPSLRMPGAICIRFRNFIFSTYNWKKETLEI